MNRLVVPPVAVRTVRRLAAPPVSRVRALLTAIVVAVLTAPLAGLLHAAAGVPVDPGWLLTGMPWPLSATRDVVAVLGASPVLVAPLAAGLLLLRLPVAWLLVRAARPGPPPSPGRLISVTLAVLAAAPLATGLVLAGHPVLSALLTTVVAAFWVLVVSRSRPARFLRPLLAGLVLVPAALLVAPGTLTSSLPGDPALALAALLLGAVEGALLVVTVVALAAGRVP